MFNLNNTLFDDSLFFVFFAALRKTVLLWVNFPPKLAEKVYNAIIPSFLNKSIYSQNIIIYYYITYIYYM